MILVGDGETSSLLKSSSFLEVVNITGFLLRFFVGSGDSNMAQKSVSFVVTKVK